MDRANIPISKGFEDAYETWFVVNTWHVLLTNDYGNRYDWAQNQNSKPKIYIGASACTSCNGSDGGYVSPCQFCTQYEQIFSNKTMVSSLGGAMLWDLPRAVGKGDILTTVGMILLTLLFSKDNDNYDQNVKNYMTSCSGGSCSCGSCSCSSGMRTETCRVDEFTYIGSASSQDVLML
jgi:hypothetical protein